MEVHFDSIDQEEHRGHAGEHGRDHESRPEQSAEKRLDKLSVHLHSKRIKAEARDTEANFDTETGNDEHTCASPRAVTYTSDCQVTLRGRPQIDTSLVVRDDSYVLIDCNEKTNPRVLHIARLTGNISRHKSTTVDIAQYQRTKVRPVDTRRKDGDLHGAKEIEKLAKLKQIMIHASY